MTVRTGTATSHYNFLDLLQAALVDEGHAWGKTYAGTGNGTLTGTVGETGGYRGGASSVAETFTLTATNATTFSVVGSVSGSLGSATVGTAFAHAKINFRINAGGTAFIAGDVFTINTSPKWTLMRRHGVRNSTFRTGNLVNLQNLYDGDIATWATLDSASLPGTAAIEQIGVAEVKAITIGVGGTLNRGAADFALEWSDNGTAWTQAQAWTAVTWTAIRQRQTFTVSGSPGSHLHWRMKVTAINGGTQFECNELDFLTSIDSDYALETRAQAVFMAPGLDGTKQIHVGCELYEDSAAGVYNLNCYGHRTHNSKLGVRTQVNTSGLRCLPLSNTSFGYWMFINGQRAIVVCKIGTVYVSAYLGFAYPYETPTTHPWPCITGACGSIETRKPDSTDASFRAFFDPGQYSLAAYYPDNTWRLHSNRYQSSSDQPDYLTPGKVYPSAMNATGARAYLRENLDGSYPLIPLVLVNTNPRHAWGELDGCWWTSGFGISSEAQIARDGFQHLVIQNCFRTTADAFMAVRMD